MSFVPRGSVEVVNVATFVVEEALQPGRGADSV
jgi:hypothetical protein